MMSAGENASRFDTEARFAKHCGVAPIPASSGKTSGRMRLNRGDVRRANKTLPKPEVSGQELREARLMAGMRQKDVTGILAMSVPSVSKVERGLASELSGVYRTYLKWYRNGMTADVEKSKTERNDVEKKNRIGTCLL